MKNRKIIRLQHFDYSQPAAYFVTICAHQSQHQWGEVQAAQIIPNDWGSIIINEFYKTETIRDNVSIDTFMLMPNHLHCILVIHPKDSERQDFYYPDFRTEPSLDKIQAFGKFVPDSLPTIIRQIKSCATQQVRKMGFPSDQKHWQRGYYERVVRNPQEMQRIRTYILNNPYKWEQDRLYFQKLLDKMTWII